MSRFSKSEQKLTADKLRKLQIYLYAVTDLDFSLEKFAGIEIAANIRSKFSYSDSSLEVPVSGSGDFLAGFLRNQSKEKVKFTKTNPENATVVYLQSLDKKIKYKKAKFYIIPGFIKLLESGSEPISDTEFPVLEYIDLNYVGFTILNNFEYEKILEMNTKIEYSYSFNGDTAFFDIVRRISGLL